MCHFAPRHLGAAIARLCHRDHVRFGHFRAEKSNETDNQQSAEPDSAHNFELNAGLIESKPSLFDFDGLG